MNRKRYIGLGIGLVIGLIAMIVPAKWAEKESVSMDNKELSLSPQLISNLDKVQLIDKDKISPFTLCDWIIEGRRSYYLIDIRSEKEYQKDNIRSAINIPFMELAKSDYLYGLPKDKLIILYSDTEQSASVLWKVLKTLNYKVYILKGGYQDWQTIVLNPKAPAETSSDEDFNQYKTRASVAAFLKGESLDVDSTLPKRKAKAIIPLPIKKGKDQGC